MAAAPQIGAPAPSALRLAPKEVQCAHCGLPVPLGLQSAGLEAQFCCEGCRSVFAILHASGLEDYYAHREREPNTPESPRRSQRKFEELDAPAFQTTHCVAQSATLSSVDFYLEGIHC